MTVAGSVGRLADRAEIVDLIALSAHAFDRRRWELYDTIFADHATCAFLALDGPWRVWRNAARGFAETALDVSHHQLGTTVMRFEGEGVEAESYVVAFLRTREDATATGFLPIRGGTETVTTGWRWLDRFTRADGRWRLTARRAVGNWRDSEATPHVDAHQAKPVFGADDLLTLPVIGQWTA